MPQERRNIAIVGGLVVAAGLAAFVGALFLIGREADEEPPQPPPEPEPGEANLYGYITDSSTGEPIVGASMTVYQDVTETQTETYKATTDQWGYYELLGMVVGVSADMVIYAGGYVTYTRQGMSITEGGIELNITLAWAGGPRDVPRVTGYSLPAGIPSGGEFEAKLKVYVQNFTEYRVSPQLRLYSQETPRCNLTMQFRLVHRSIWEQLRESTQLGYLPFEGEGEIEISDIGVAVCRHFGEIMPPGLYDVSYHINRAYCEVTDTGGLQVWGSATPGYYNAKGQLGTVEVV